MAAQSRTTLKTYFNTGDTPTETQFANLIDSMQNIPDDGTALTDITAESIGDLSDVGDATATSGNVLVADGDSWESRALTESDISDLGTYLTDITGESIEDLSDVTITTGAQGDILYNNGSAWVNLAPGTNGQYLQTQGAAANPQWATLSGGGDMAAATYDPATISEQLVGLTASQTLTNKTIDADNNTISNIALGAEATGAIDDLSDVTITTPADNEVLAWNGTDTWINQTPAEAGLAEASHTHVEADITDLGTYLTDITGEDLGDLADVTIDTPADNEVLAWNGTDTWINQTAAEAGLAAASHAHAASDITSGTLAHEQGGIEADISAVTTGDILAGTGAGTIGIVAASGASDGDVLTLQGDGTVAYETPAAGGGGGPRGFTYVIAASDSLDNTGVDATCDGTADDVEIQAGIDAVNTAGGGTVMLLDGTYEIDAIVNLKSNVTLKGQGYGTVLTRSDATDFFETANSTTVSNAFVRNLLLDSNEQDAHIYDDNGLLTNSGFIDFWVIDHTASSRIFDWSDTGVSGVIKGGVFENCNKMGSFNDNIFITDCYFNVESPITSSNSTIIYGAGPTTNCVFNVENFTTSISIGIFNFSGNPGTIFSNNKVYGLEGTTTPFYFNTRTVFTNNMIYELSTGSYTGVAFWLSSSNASGSTISGNMAYLASSTGDEILKAGSGANEITISGNYFRAGRGLSISYDNWTVTGNTLYISGLIGVNITGNYTVFSGNTIYAQGSNCRALQMSNADIGNVVTNNSFRGNNTSTIPIYWASDPYMDASSSYILENNSWVYMGGTPQTNGIECYEAKYEIMNNGTGGSSADGQVVVKSLDTSSLTYEFNTTTTAGDPTVVGVCIEVASSDNQARIVTKGPVDNLKVDGTDDIAVGDPLSTFTSAGIAQKAATGETVFAIAMEAYTTDDSNGVINAMVIEPYIMP